MKTSELAKKIRISILEQIHRSNGSHIGSAFSIVDIVSTLYNEVLNYDFKNPNWEKRDRLILSKGHACIAIYSALAEFGVISKNELNTYGQNNSNLMNHISHKVNGVEFSTGALGHGLPFGVGKALSAKIKKEDWKTFVIIGDGEINEGSNWEALMFANHHNLNNLYVIVDYNKLQSLDTTENTIALEPLALKFESFGCEVHKINGHNINEIKNCCFNSKNDKPKIIIANTIKGKGVSFMENKVEWHYKSPNQNELEKAIKEINSSL